MPLLEIASVTKRYEPPPRLLRPLIRVAARQPVEALRRVSFDVDRGEVVGLVGPNGAGKTTLLKVVCSLLEPTEGSVRIDGHDVRRPPKGGQARIGLVLEGDRGLYDRLTGRQNLEFFGAMFGLEAPLAARRAEELLDRLGLRQRDKLVFGYSAGMRMRLSIARALLSEPPLLVLDEPTRSLDPVVSAQTGELLRDLAGAGQAVLLSNHRLDEIVRYCDRIVAIVGGAVRFEGRVDELAPDPADWTATLVELLQEVRR